MSLAVVENDRTQANLFEEILVAFSKIGVSRAGIYFETRANTFVTLYKRCDLGSVFTSEQRILELVGKRDKVRYVL